MTCDSRKKKEGIFCTAYFVRREFFKDLCFISMYSVLNTLSEYTYLYILKTITSYAFVAYFQNRRKPSVCPEMSVNLSNNKKSESLITHVGYVKSICNMLVSSNN